MIHIAVVIVLLVASVVTIALKKLTAQAALVGWLLAILIYAGSGFAGLALLVVFFAAGTFATKLKYQVKYSLGIAEANKGIRQPAQVAANAGMAAIVASLAIVFSLPVIPHTLLIAGCFSAATADTLSSELGNVYGRKYYNILNLQPGIRGYDGVVSMQGTMAGLVGSILVAFVFFIFYPVKVYMLIIVLSGTAGNYIDSLLGALYERNGKLNNDQVNFLNTATGAVTSLILYVIGLFFGWI